LEIILLLGIALFGVIGFLVVNSMQQGQQSGSSAPLEPIPPTTDQYLIQKLGFQKAENKRFSFPRYLGQYQERQTDLYIDSDEFFTIQMSFNNAKNYIFQVQEKSGHSFIDKLILALYSRNDIFLDRQSGRKFAIYTRPETLRAKLFATNSPIWASLRKFPSFDHSIEVGFSVKSTTSLTYQHAIHAIKSARMAQLLKAMDECCKVLEYL